MDKDTPECTTTSSKDGTINLLAEEKTMSKRQMKRLRREEMRLSKPKAKKRKVAASVLIHDAMMKETSYYYENGLRKVYPYHFTYCTHAKGRWVGKTLMEIFKKEFQAYTPREYEEAIKNGNMRVNEKKIDANYKLKNNDRVTNRVHRHELPVTAERLQICYEDEHVVVVNKPSSIAIHPCGRFRHNSLTYILAREFNFPNLRSIYRLDRLTSGVYIMCKDEGTTKKMQEDIKERRVQKEYICRVVGKFPDGEVVCDEPLDVLDHTLSVYGVCSDGKESKTTFNIVHYDGCSSVVKCRPHTGRTHQIRVHLQYLGHPIVNDPLYNTEVWGLHRGKGGEFGKSLEQLLADMRVLHNSNQFLEAEYPAGIESEGDPEETASGNNHAERSDTGSTSHDSVREHIPQISSDSNRDDNSSSSPSTQHHSNPLPENDTGTSQGSCCDGIKFSLADSGIEPLDASKLVLVPDCPHCKLEYRDPKPSELVMYLHAYNYKGPNWEYSTPLPEWADEAWTP